MQVLTSGWGHTHSFTRANASHQHTSSSLRTPARTCGERRIERLHLAGDGELVEGALGQGQGQQIQKLQLDVLQKLRQRLGNLTVHIDMHMTTSMHIDTRGTSSVRIDTRVFGILACLSASACVHLRHACQQSRWD